MHYPGLPGNRWHAAAQRYLPRGAGLVLSFDLAGNALAIFVDSLRLLTVAANIGDARSLVVHPATTTHSHLDDHHLTLAGFGRRTLRLSIGLEDPDDLIEAYRPRWMPSPRTDMHFGYWTPIYGGFLRNLGDENMPTTWEYIKQLSQTADRLDYHTTPVPELYLNDRKGIHAPSLEAWSLSSAILAVTRQLRVMTAVRPGFHLPAVTAKTSATLTDIGTTPGSNAARFALNVVAAWWEEEAKQYGGIFTRHDQRYRQASEFVDILRGLWQHTPFTYSGAHYTVHDAILSPKPAVPPPIFAGGESESGRESIATFADSYVLHGDTVEEIQSKIADMNARSQRIHQRDMAEFGMSAYLIVRDTEAEARAELDRITTVAPNSGISRREYSVGTRGLRPDLVGTPQQVADKIRDYQEAGLTLLLIQCSPAHYELPRIAEQIFPLVAHNPT
ncbi:LLM class flavin-dependent oxidoreductase [Nocardia africana]|uniref:LLM class flavin-dependent oxidoreductase n=1 Tax=Nocardia africana TaxID=134964 RepID=A0ABW6NCM5_9NOCA